MYEQNLGVVPVNPLASLVGPLVQLFQGKPSNFSAWVTFDKNGHQIGSGGDKPNSNTVSMASAIGQGLSSWVQQMNAAGVTFNAPGTFSVEIGQRDNSRVFLGTRPKNAQQPVDVGGAGDPNSALQGAINWLKRYATGASANAAMAAQQQATTGTVQPMAQPTGTVMPPTPVPGTVTSPVAQMSYPTTATPLTYEPATPMASPGYVPAGAQSAAQAGFASNPTTMLMFGGFALVALFAMNNQAPASRARRRR